MKEQAFLKGLGRQVRIFRKDKRLTQVELGERAGIGMKYVGEVERGTTNPTLRLVWRLSRALEVEMFELFLFSSNDGDQDGKVRSRLMRTLKDHNGKVLEKIERLIKLMLTE